MSTFNLITYVKNISLLTKKKIANNLTVNSFNSFLLNEKHTQQGYGYCQLANIDRKSN